ncbi:hypothetical protein [Actinacidiphila glaucinigra]|uniref:hypothetical protein n=1 Tax=Actinacidiphila glaucinigra TaxID=235986 RepID=UPI0035E17D7E
MRQAIADAAVRPRDADALVAHATSTPRSDLAEINAIGRQNASLVVRHPAR